MRNAFAYICITLLVLLFLNIYSASKTRTLMFQAKTASAQDKLELVVSSFGGVDAISEESASQIISVLGDLNVTRLLVTDGEARAVYDSSVGQNAEGRYVLLEEVVQALQGNDVLRCVYAKGTLESYAAMPVMVRGESVGCVYMMEYDAEQGQVIENLERNILFSSLLLLGMIILASVIFTLTGSRRMRKIVTSVRMAREGEYSQKIRIRGSDEMGKLANEFNKLTERLQESETKQRQFISDASHELKTPLSSIKLLSDSILQNEMDVNTMREFVADIGRESDRLTRLAQDILMLDRTDREADIEHEVVYADEVISRVFRMLIPLASEKGIDLTGSFEPNCSVLTAEDDLYQILFNLVENGIKYNRENGGVHVTLWRDGDDVKIMIEDTGVGIPPQSIDHVFERFYRVDKARSRAAGGSGLGLCIVKELVERNYGTIRVSSIENVGTKFTVMFPWFEVSEQEDEEHA